MKGKVVKQQVPYKWSCPKCKVLYGREQKSCCCCGWEKKILGIVNVNKFHSILPKY